MKIVLFGCGYVGLTTAICLAELGHQVTCIDVDKQKINMLKQGESPLYEPGIDIYIKQHTLAGNLFFANEIGTSIQGADFIFIAVGTPQRDDGSADLTNVFEVSQRIAECVVKDVIVVVKSTVPVGTNDAIKKVISEKKRSNAGIQIASNPEFLREGSALHDTFQGERIIIGASEEDVFEKMETLYKPLHIPIVKTDIKSAEMIKYASNAFLATKISFINEMANLCEKVGADIEQVAYGMGLDKRIGNAFLKAGIGYGGSCFPKDTNALMQIAGNVQYPFQLLASVIAVNHEQKRKFINKLQTLYGDIVGKRIAVLGLAFKPNTDDIREAPAISIIEELFKFGAQVIAYDPVAIQNAKKVLPNEVSFVSEIDQAITDADCVCILTEWDEIKNYPLINFQKLMKEATIFDGRNCFTLEEIEKYEIQYHSIGRRQVIYDFVK
ncbi:UDP-glucose/GDP-mannose dehydrogenase family protein [Bacillus sp. DX1.1]|uniref:UDP-glucose dehydrogenase family protein n=1 Tax=unclassified Bacillus (in: firmicutes) TaxID=185979 RepID=UPI002570AA5D|nr:MULTISPECIES: UDP-glucose/GDP-mannose dehydrogenase family protein [unclassified Bacillus (in: firmicutes)]MDM5154215.1 UDP-glucose/GDP-mannose dehydrogenase family protein [Bacillus sp. DX1.1]WJE83135.1 UDP-glucose/GDP-mannose dehydrogenase family protein [Bacillus sp. DX3.1]